MAVVMRRAVGLVATALAVSCLVSTHAMASAGEAEAPGPTLRVSFLAEAGVHGVPEMRVRLSLPLSAGFRHPVERLRATPVGSSGDYPEALETVLRRAGFLDRDQASRVVEVQDRPPSLLISQGAATLALADTYPVLFDSHASGEAWTLPSIEVPPHGRLNVVMRLGEGERASVFPLPDEDRGTGVLRWTLGPGPSPEIRVRIEGGTEGSGGPGPWQPVVAFAVEALPFLILLMLMAGGPPSVARRQLVLLAAAGLAISAGCCAYFVLTGTVPAIGDELLSQFGERGLVVARMVVPLLGVAAYVVLASRHRVATAIAVLALAAAFSASVVPSGRFQGEYPLEMVSGEEGLALAVACFLAIGLAFATIVAAGAWFFRIAPAPVESWKRALPRIYWLGPILLLAVGLVAQLVLAAHGRPDGAPEFFQFDSPWVEVLGRNLEELPFMLANLSRNLTAVLLALGLSLWLWRRAGEAEPRFSSWRECAALALLLSSAVIGLGGEVDGYAIPVAFLFSFAGIAGALRLASGGAWARAAADPAVKGSAERLLKQATQIAALRRRRQEAVERLSSGDLEIDGFEQEVKTLDRRRSSMSGDDSLGSLEPDRRGRAVLAFGLNGDAGARRRLEALFRKGWWIVAVPTVYSAISFLGHHTAGAVSAEQPLGLAFLLVGLAFQLLTWPVAAWCFVLALPVLPGWIGPLKGLVAGLFCALPAALASILVDDPVRPGQWIFLATVLALLFVAIGLFFDYRAVRDAKGDLRQLGELYRIDGVRTGLAYAATVVALVFGVADGLASGSGAKAIHDAASSFSSAVSPK